MDSGMVRQSKMFKNRIVALKDGLGQRSALLAPSKTLAGRHEAWVCTTLSTSLCSPFPPSSFSMKGATRKDEKQFILSMPFLTLGKMD